MKFCWSRKLCVSSEAEIRKQLEKITGTSIHDAQKTLTVTAH